MNRNLRRLMRRAARGFTLIEMLVVIAIIAPPGRPRLDGFFVGAGLPAMKR